MIDDTRLMWTYSHLTDVCQWLGELLNEGVELPDSHWLEMANSFAGNSAVYVSRALAKGETNG